MSEEQSILKQKKTWEHRRTQRVLIQIPVLVYGHTPGSGPFREETQTVQVSAHGGLLLMETPVERGQKLILTHMTTQKEVACHVIYVGEKRGPKTEIGIGFARAAHQFWHIVFPPEDWKKA